MRRFLLAAATAAWAFTTSLPDARAQDLAPPPPMDPNAPGGQPLPGTTTTTTTQEQATTAKLDQAEREDSGRNFELFWLDAYLGGSYINMAAFSQETLSLQKTDSAGPMFALGAGLRFVLLTLGVRMKYNALSAFNMWQLNAELGFKIPIDKVDLLIGTHGGYSFVGSLGDAGVATSSAIPTSSDAVSIRGFNVGLDLAVDYYVTPAFSIGGGFFGDFLYLNRPPVDIPADLPAEAQAAIQNDPLYQKSGTSAGMQLGGALRLGLHFGL